MSMKESIAPPVYWPIYHLSFVLPLGPLLSSAKQAALSTERYENVRYFETTIQEQSLPVFQMPCLFFIYFLKYENIQNKFTGTLESPWFF